MLLSRRQLLSAARQAPSLPCSKACLSPSSPMSSSWAWSAPNPTSHTSRPSALTGPATRPAKSTPPATAASRNRFSSPTPSRRISPHTGELRTAAAMSGTSSPATPRCSASALPESGMRSNGSPELRGSRPAKPPSMRPPHSLAVPRNRPAGVTPTLRAAWRRAGLIQPAAAEELRRALTDNFEGHSRRRAYLLHKVPIAFPGHPDEHPRAHRIHPLIRYASTHATLGSASVSDPHRLAAIAGLQTMRAGQPHARGPTRRRPRL